MPVALCVAWTVTPLIAPQPIVACTGCGTRTPFRSSGKFRLNASGKRLDAWLIYRCTICERTWNRPIFERRTVGEIDPALLQALQSNDQGHATVLAFDTEDLRRSAPEIMTFPRVDIARRVVGETPVFPCGLEVRFDVPLPVSSRLDRVLAQGLDLSRARIARLAGDRLLLLEGKRDRLRKPVRHGARVRIDLSGLEDGPAIVAAATGNAAHLPPSAL